MVRRWRLDGEGINDATIRPARVDVMRIGLIGDETVVALARGVVASVEARSRRVKNNPIVHADRVNGVGVVSSLDGAFIFEGSHDGEIRVYNVKQKNEILKFIASPGRNTKP